MPIARKADARREIANRWTSKLVEDGWTPISDAFLREYSAIGITSSEAILLIHLISFKWDESKPFPSMERLAKRMGMTTTAVRNHVRSLEKKGFLKRVPQNGRSNAFDLTPLFEKLEDQIKSKRE